MKNKVFLVSILLFLITLSSFSFAGYVAPTFEGQPIIIESGSDFYGSSTGFVTIDLNLTAIDTTFKDFFVRITGLDDTNTRVHEISFNKEKTEVISYPIYETSKTKINQKLLDKTPMEIVLEFDPNEIGIGREFDIQLVDKDGVIIADLDPFLSGFDYRQEWCLNTDGISLSGDITNDHVIYFDFSSNTDFLANASSDGNGIKFTDLSNNEYNFHFEGTGINNSWVGVTETFSSSADTCGYTYYGGDSSQNYEDESGTYSSGYVHVYDFSETSGQLLDKVGSLDSTSQSGTQNQTGKIGKGYYHGLGVKTTIPDNSSIDFDSTDFSISFWTNSSNSTNDKYINKGAVANNKGYSFQRNSSKLTLKLANGSTQVTNDSTTNINSGNWDFVVGKFDRSSNMIGYIDSVQEISSSITSFSSIGNSDDLTFSGCDGLIDELKIFNYVVSSDEVKLLYNSENNNLVSFSGEETSNNVPFVEITSPTNEQEYFSSIDINFSVNELDGENLDLNIYYSDIAGQKDTLIYSDSNLADGSGVVCSDYNFIDGADCFYSWNILAVEDGNWFIDLETSDGIDTNEISSDEFVINQRETIYPREASFTSLGVSTTTSTSYVPVIEFDFNYLFANTPMFATCVFDTNSQSVGTITGDYQISKSNDGVTYAEVGTASVTMSGSPTFFNSVAITTNDFNSANNVDSNIHFRLSQKRTGGGGTTKEISMVNPVCVVTMINDVNGFDLPMAHKTIDVSTSSTSYVVLDSFTLPKANYFYRNISVGNFAFYQTIAGGTPSLRFCTNGICSAEFSRYVNSGSVGSGSTFGTTMEFNPAQSVDLNIELKTTAGTGQVTSELHNIAGAFEVGESRGLGFDNNTFSNTTYQEIAVLDFNNKGNIGSFVASANLPFSCSASNCLLETFLRVQGSSYDQNSLVRKRTSSTTETQIGFLNSIYTFDDIPVEDDLNITMYAKTSTGTITLVSGGIAISNFSEVGSVGLIAPSITAIDDWTNRIIDTDTNFAFNVSDPDGNCLNGSADLNIFESATDNQIASFIPTLSLNGSSCDANYLFNPLSVADNNYYWVYSFTDEDGLSNSNGRTDRVFIVDNNAPLINVTLPVDSNNDSRSVINVEFTLTDPSFSDFNIDLNYSSSASQGSGTSVLLQELVSTSGEIICIGSFVTGSTCSYDLDLSGVADGNYFVLIQATTNARTGFDASQEFSIYEGTEPIVTTSDVNYIERYINPVYEQRDENRYFNPNTAYDLTEEEKQNIYLQQVTSILIVISLIIGAGVLMLWKRK